MKSKIITVFLLTALMICSFFVNASVVQLETTKEKFSDLNEDLYQIGGKNSGYGGWHPMESRGYNGKDFTSIEGDWEYWGTYSIRESPNDGEDDWCKAKYLFSDDLGLGDTCVKYLNIFLILIWVIHLI